MLLYLIARDEVDDVMDGFVYGAICGLGFAIVEDVFYFMAVFGGSRRACCRASGSAWWRAACTGTCCTRASSAWRSGWSSRRATEPLRPALGGGGLCALAVFAHLLWNSPLLTLFPAEPWIGVDYLLVVLATAVKGCRCWCSSRSR